MRNERIFGLTFGRSRISLLRSPACGATMVVALLGPLLSPAQGQSDAMKRFEQEYPPALARLEESYAQLRGECRLLDQGWVATDGSTPGENDYEPAEFAVDLPRRMVHHTRNITAGPKRATQEQVVFTGKDSAYMLSREPGAESFSVSSLGPGPGTEGTYLMTMGMHLMAPHGVMARSMRQILSDPTFQLNAAEPVEMEDRDCLRIECQTGSEGNLNRYAIVFDPEQSWVIRSAELKAEGPLPLRVRIEVEYQPPDGQEPPLPRLVKSNGWIVCRFDRIERAPTDEAAFSMTRFGLPDLATGASNNPRAPWMLSLIAVGLACLAIALVFRHFTRRGLARPA